MLIYLFVISISMWQYMSVREYYYCIVLCKKLNKTHTKNPPKNLKNDNKKNNTKTNKPKNNINNKKQQKPQTKPELKNVLTYITCLRRNNFNTYKLINCTINLTMCCVSSLSASLYTGQCAAAFYISVSVCLYVCLCIYLSIYQHLTSTFRASCY